ncbi:MAG TPA: hypothetical protein VEL76_36140, partial [Gemmataceae bacterium]|nr:hypothetical protein [Gemmataceae bacterium]
MKAFAHRRGPGICAVAGFALVALAAAAPTARADAIDDALLERGRAMMKYLRNKDNKDVKNVGVLKFQVQVRDGKPRMEVGRLNSLMETRLENVLILANEDDKRVIGVTRGASQAAAARDKNATYLTAEGLAKLFAQEYPLAWGKEKVKVDRFLTGIVQTSPDLKQTTVIIHAYRPGRAEPQEVTRFTVA